MSPPVTPPNEQEAPPLPSTTERTTELHEPVIPDEPTIKYHPLSVHVICSLMASSVLGALARLGIQALTTYDGQAIFPLAWVQATGCLVMGIAIGLRPPITAFYPPLYTAITTGFCGSLTTFSGWEMDVFLAFENAANFDRIGFKNAVDGLGRIFFTFAASLSGVSLGMHLATIIPFPRLAHPGPTARNIISAVSLIIYIAMVPLYATALPPSSPSWRFGLFSSSALIFSFPGALTRHILGHFLNPCQPTFPLGTFNANMIGTTLLAIFHVLQRARGLPHGAICSILQGLSDGFCGCLSTVSSFAAELKGLKARHAWRYAIVSIVFGQCILIIIVGSARWTGGIRENTLCSLSIE